MAEIYEDIKNLMTQKKITGCYAAKSSKHPVLIQTFCGVCGLDITGKPDCPTCSTKDWVSELAQYKVLPCPFCGCEAVADPVELIGWIFNHQEGCITDHVRQIYWDDVELREKWNAQPAMIELSTIKEELAKDALYAQPYRAAYEALIRENPSIIQHQS